jgi:hypothetical protein
MTDIEFSPPVESARINWSYLWGVAAAIAGG